MPGLQPASGMTRTVTTTSWALAVRTRPPDRPSAARTVPSLSLLDILTVRDSHELDVILSPVATW